MSGKSGGMSLTVGRKGNQFVLSTVPKCKPSDPHLSGTSALPSNSGVFTNHFHIQLSLKKLEKYTITFKPLSKDGNDTDDGEGARAPRELRACERRSIMLKLLENGLNGTMVWTAYPWVTDYSATVWSAKPFPEESDLIFRDIDYERQNGRRSQCAEVQFEHKETIDLSLAPARLDQDSITAINALITHHVSHATTNAMNVRANKFYVREGFTDFGDGLHAYRGYFTSVRAGPSKLLLNVNTITTPFLAPLRVSDFMLGMQGHSEYSTILERLLKNVRVRILYMRNKHPTSKRDPNTEDARKKVITDLGSKPHLQKVTASSSQTVAEYFNDLGAIITQPDLKCVNVGRPKSSDGQKIWIPAEFLAIEPSQPFRGAMSAQYTTRMIENAVRLPPANAGLIIREGIPLLGVNPADASLGNLGLHITPQLMRIKIEEKAPPVLKYGAVKQGARGKEKLVPTNASWNLTEVRFYRPGLRHEHATQNRQPVVSILDLSPTNKKTGLSNIPLDAVIHNFSLQFGKLGMPGPAMNDIYYNHHPELGKKGTLSDWKYFEAMNALFKQLYGVGFNSNKDPRHPGPLLVVLSNADKLTYAMVKRVADKLGVQTVCTQLSKLQRASTKNDGGFFGNLALKFNIKLGGTNHLVLLSKDDSSAFRAIPKSTMVIGADVVHPPGGAAPGFPSIAAIAASDGSEHDNFPGSMRFNPARQEIIEELEDMVVERLKAYHTKNKHLPQNIVFYRDGVSDGQYAAVSKDEVRKVRLACERAVNVIKVPMPPVNITFIIVQKRHHTRFYTQPNLKERINGNVPPGFVVNTEVVRASPSNFYLQSHHAVKGTARSAHYVILTNEIKELQAMTTIVDITHGFCYNYARATKGVCYCGPTYYADRLCDRGYHYVRWLFSDPKNAAITPGKRRENETDEEYARRVAQQFAEHGYWNHWNNPANRANRANPWHPNLDNTMFYL